MMRARDAGSTPRTASLDGGALCSDLKDHIYSRHMDEDVRRKIVPGVRIRITQQIAARHYSWSSVVEGVIVEYAQRETGSWFAHSRDDKLWLDRLVIRKDDGEITTLNLDDYSVVEVLGQEQAPAEAQKQNESDLPV